MKPNVAVIDDPATVEVLSNPTRLQVLGALNVPASAATVARAIGKTRQNANYHLKELERVGLIERAGERRVGNFIESLYVARARSLVISPRLTLGGPERAEALAAQVSLERLVSIGERVGRDAAALLSRAAFDGETIPSAAVELEARFEDEEDRERFMREYLAAVAALSRKYCSRRGRAFRVALTAYPQTDEPEPGPETGGPAT